jgi:Fe-S-cluster containining protein
MTTDKIKEAAERNRDAILHENYWMNIDVLAIRAQKIAMSQNTYKVKRKKLIEIVNLANVAIAPHAACTAGCSQCCHIAVAITQSEANEIAKAIGRAAVVMPEASEKALRQSIESRDQYRGVPCAFLVNNLCSIYDHRPVACRSHHSLDANADQCNLAIPNKDSHVPSFNLTMLEFSLAALAFEQQEGIADIRDFFPSQVRL